jgi:hypothetical protein
MRKLKSSINWTRKSFVISALVAVLFLGVANAAPLNVRDVNNGDLSPFQAEASWVYPTTSADGSAAFSVQDHRLVIAFVSGAICLEGASPFAFFVKTVFDGVETVHRLPVQPTINSGPDRCWLLSQPVTIFADPNSQILVGSSNSGGGGGMGWATLSGHYVNNR